MIILSFETCNHEGLALLSCKDVAELLNKERNIHIHIRAVMFITLRNATGNLYIQDRSRIAFVSELIKNKAKR